jgi:two-component system, NarL family, response regulator YdfI
MIRVLIIAEAEIERAGLEAVIKTSDGLDVAGSLGEARRLQQALDELGPDVIVFAAHSGAGRDEDTEAVLSNWREASRSSAGVDGLGLVVLAEEIEPGHMAAALRAGSFALLGREASAREIRASIEAVAAGLVTLEPSFADGVSAALRPPAPPRIPGTSLTPREIEVLRLIAEGLANKEIASRLEISDHTVKFHITSIFNKLDVSNRAEAVSNGMRLGLIMV